MMHRHGCQPGRPVSTTHVPRSLNRSYGRHPQTRTMTLPLNTPVLKFPRLCTSRRHLRLNLPVPRAVEYAPDPWLAAHLLMSSTGRILQTQIQTLLLTRDGSGASARSHLLPRLNNQHQRSKKTLRKLKAANLIDMTMNFARSGVS